MVGEGADGDCKPGKLGPSVSICKMGVAITPLARAGEDPRGDTGGWFREDSESGVPGGRANSLRIL